jgi:hypothetical protein
MDKILVDTNIVLDLLGKRQKFLPEVQQYIGFTEKHINNLTVSKLA